MATGDKERVKPLGSEGGVERPSVGTETESAKGPNRKEEAEASVTEIHVPQPEIASTDFFLANETRLGYKSRLTLAIRTVLAGLEREASTLAGKSVDGLRSQFLAARTQRDAVRMLSEYQINDYRVFLVLYIAALRRRTRV